MEGRGLQLEGGEEIQRGRGGLAATNQSGEAEGRFAHLRSGSPDARGLEGRGRRVGFAGASNIESLSALGKTARLAGPPREEERLRPGRGGGSDRGEREGKTRDRDRGGEWASTGERNGLRPGRQGGEVERSRPEGCSRVLKSRREAGETRLFQIVNFSRSEPSGEAVRKWGGGWGERVSVWIHTFPYIYIWEKGISSQDRMLQSPLYLSADIQRLLLNGLRSTVKAIPSIMVKIQGGGGRSEGRWG